MSRSLTDAPEGAEQKYEDGGDEVGREETAFHGGQDTGRAVACYVEGWMDGISMPT